MAKTFKEKLEKVKEEAKIPFKTKIMVHQMRKIMTMPKLETEEEKKAFKEQQKRESKIFKEGLEAVGHIAEMGHAVSTPRRFGLWAEEKELRHETSDWTIDRKAWNKDEPIQRNGKWFIPHEEFKQTGYGAWHIGSRIDELKREGRDVLIIDTPRNRRFLFKEAKAGELEKKVTE